MLCQSTLSYRFSWWGGKCERIVFCKWRHARFCTLERERGSSLPGMVGTSLPKRMQSFILVALLARPLTIQEAPHSILNLKTVPQIEIWRSFPHITQGNAVKATESKSQPFTSTSLKIQHAQPWWTLREPESVKGVPTWFKSMLLIPDTVSSDPEQLVSSQDGS